MQKVLLLIRARVTCVYVGGIRRLTPPHTEECLGRRDLLVYVCCNGDN